MKGFTAKTQKNQRVCSVSLQKYFFNMGNNWNKFLPSFLFLLILTLL